VTFKRAFAALTIIGLSISPVFAAEAEKEDSRLGPAAPISAFRPQTTRPPVLTALYVSLGAMQAWDLYSTSAALKAGATEANPSLAGMAHNNGAMIGMKLATTAGTIFFAERMWKKNKVGAIVMMVAINGATAAVSMHNMRNAQIAGRR
jgi:hypothetical protein